MEFQLHENMENVKDSMQFDSGTLIAEYQDSDLSATIEVIGDVRVVFEDEVYKTPSDFPPELKQIIAEGNLFHDEKVKVGNNNWFEIAVFDSDKNIIDIGDDPVVDIEGKTAEQIKELCAGVVNEVREMLAEKPKQEEVKNTSKNEKCVLSFP